MIEGCVWSATYTAFGSVRAANLFLKDGINYYSEWLFGPPAVDLCDLPFVLCLQAEVFHKHGDSVHKTGCSAV
jgi:hypothetical protein